MSIARYSAPDGTETLHLHERYVLLALREEKGEFDTSHFGIGGACFAALHLHGRLRIRPGEDALVDVVDETATGDPVLDDCLGKIVSSKRPDTAMNWVVELDHRSACARIASGLCHRGILHAEEDSILLVFKRRVHKVRDPAPRRLLVDRLRRAIFDEGDAIDAETAALVALADCGDVLKALFDRNDLKRYRRRLDDISASHETSDVTSRAMRDALLRLRAIAAMTSSQ